MELNKVRSSSTSGGSHLRPQRPPPTTSTLPPDTEDEFVFDSKATSNKPAIKSALKPSSRPSTAASAEPSLQPLSGATTSALASSTPRKPEDRNTVGALDDDDVKISVIEHDSGDDVEPTPQRQRPPQRPTAPKPPPPQPPPPPKEQPKKQPGDEPEMEEPEQSAFSKPKYPWDVFRKVAREQMLDSDDKPQFAAWVQISRLIIYIILFAIVLGSVVTSRLTFLTLAGAWKDIIRVESSVMEEFFKAADFRGQYQQYCHYLTLLATLTPTLVWLCIGIFRFAFSGNQSMPPWYAVVFLIGLECAHSFGIVLFLNRVIIQQTNIWKLTSFGMALSLVPSICGLIFVSDAYSCLITQSKRKILNKLAYFTALILSIIPLIILGASSGWREIHSWEFPMSIFLISFVWTLNLIFSEPLSIGSLRIPNWPALLGDFYRVQSKLTVISCSARLGTALLADMLLSNQPFWAMPLVSPLHSFILSNMTSSHSDIMPSLDEPPGNDSIANLLSMTTKLNVTSSEAALLFGNYTIQDLADDGLLNVTSMFIAHIVSTFVAFAASTLACKLLMQQLAFALPLALATPLTVAIMLVRCQPIDKTVPLLGPAFHWLSSTFDFPGNKWYCLPKEQDEVLWVYPTVLILWYFAQNLACFHVWFPSCERLAETEKLFVLPGLCSPFLEQWLLFNRRLNDTLLLSGNDQQGRRPNQTGKESPPIVPRVIACATMWHETREEMTELLKSIFRMDKDHAERKRVLETLHAASDPETLGAASEILAQVSYYEFETHIIFDDSMHMTPDGLGMVPNEFVRTMLDVIRDAGTAVYNRFFELPDPSRLGTPYGGRLIWMLPGGTLLVVHMKDKNRMRHKKRWSQVMYMYYLLGYKLYCQDPSYRRRWRIGEQGQAKLLGEDDKIKLKLDKLDYPEVFRHVSENTARIAENTFLLTLDGDVDFRASSVLLLLDLMKKSTKVGAACGRIHPVGRGPIVWYQKFEYAIAHWLQKAAEHVFGCVLCTPGCFSMFRGSALMDDNVMRAYATTSTEAAHYVQYDQGEDRWLCTLLLQQGYRAEYSAAADALTHCPESFNEFYQQRRRWGPSTLSNIIDLLSSWKQTVIMNDNFSLPYVAYQMMLLISTLLGPATIIMMIAGAYNAVFHVDLIQAYILSLAPPAFFTAVCLTCKQELQIQTAAVMSAAYAVIMLVVVVGTIINGLQESMTSPNVIFITSLFIIFISSAGCHPREFTDLTYGWLYVLCIPAGYLLLTIYSLANMNNVSWGTRETPAPPTLADQQKKEPEPEKKKEPTGLMAKIGITSMVGDLKDFMKSMATREQSNQAAIVATASTMAASADTLPLLREIRDLLTTMASRSAASAEAQQPSRTVRFSDQSPTRVSRIVQTDPEDGAAPQIVVDEPPPVSNEPPEVDYDYWLKTTEVVGGGPVRSLEQDEIDFWNQLIRRYAYPIPDDKKRKEKIAADLKDLRNNVVFGVTMMNFLWIVITFQLQYHQDLLQYAIFVPIPRADDPSRLEYFEPLGMIFLFFFAIILVVQYTGMLAHRLDTFFHLIAAADLDFGLNACCRRRRAQAYNDRHGLGASMLGSTMMGNASAYYGQQQRRQGGSRRAPDHASVVNRMAREDAAGLSRRNKISGGRSAVSSAALKQANHV